MNNFNCKLLRFCVFLIFSSLIASCASVDKRVAPSEPPLTCEPETKRWPAGKPIWKLHEKTMHVSVTTNYMNTLDRSDFLSGHYSEAHENQVLKELQQILASELKGEPGIDLNLVQLLPPNIEDASIHVLNYKLVSRRDRYVRYQIDYTMRINVLYPDRILESSYEYKGQARSTHLFESNTKIGGIIGAR